MNATRDVSETEHDRIEGNETPVLDLRLDRLPNLTEGLRHCLQLYNLGHLRICDILQSGIPQRFTIGGGAIPGPEEFREIRDVLAGLGVEFAIPRAYEVQPKSTKRHLGLNQIHRLSKALRKRARQRGLEYP